MKKVAKWTAERPRPAVHPVLEQKRLEEKIRQTKKKLNEFSPFLRSQFSNRVREIRKKMRKGAIDDMEMSTMVQEAIDEFMSHTESEAKLLDYISKALVGLQEELSAERYQRRRRALERKLAQAEADLRELRCFARMRELESRLAASYIYLPSSMMHEITHHERGGVTRDLVKEVRNRTLRQHDRDAMLAELEAVLEKYEGYLASPSKALEFLRSERQRIYELSHTGAMEDGASKLRMIHRDMKMAGSLADSSAAARAGGARLRLNFGGFTVTTTSDGRDVLLVSDSRGNDVVFLSNSTNVITAHGDAIFDSEGRLKQVRTAKGETVQLEGGKFVRACDAEGNWLFMDPSDNRRYAVVKADGTIVTDKDELERLYREAFSPLLDFVQRESEVLGTDGGGDFRRILNTALELRKSPDLAESIRRLAIAVPEEEQQMDETTLCAAQAGLKEALSNAGYLSVDGRFRKDGFDVAVRELAPSTILMIAGAIRKNHRANLNMDLSRVLMLELDEKLLPDAREPDELYARVFVVKAGKRYVSVLLLHSKMVDAIRGSDYERVGRLVYKRVIEELHEQGMRAVGFKLALMPNSDVCKFIEDGYGPAFMKAMRTKNFYELGRQELFDRLIHEATIAHVRPRIRARVEDEQARLRLPDQERLAADYLLIRTKGCKSKDQYKKEILAAYREVYDEDGNLPTNQFALKKRVEELKDDFFRNPSEMSYTKFQKAVEFRGLLTTLEDRALACMSMAGRAAQVPADDKYKKKCRQAFKAELELELLKRQGLAADEAVAIAMQVSKYHRRTVPTCWPICEFLRDLVKKLGQEAVLNAVRSEETPWDVVRAAKQLERITRTYNTDYLKVKMELARKEKVRENVYHALKIISKVIRIGWRLAPISTY